MRRKLNRFFRILGLTGIGLSCIPLTVSAHEGLYSPALQNAPLIKQESKHPVEMNPTKQVFPIGSKAYFKIIGDAQTGFEVEFADREIDESYQSVPSAFIQGSEYNQGNIAYGIYVTNDGKFHVVALDECHYDEETNTYIFYHSTIDGATVSDETDSATNADPTMSTEFFVNIQNGIDPDGDITTDEKVPSISSSDDRIEYEITVATHTNYNLNATVPMYVCMYGYRATGDIIAPTQDAYRIKNSSTINYSAQATIKDIVRVTKLTQIYDKDHSDDQIHSIAYNKIDNTYTYWYSDPTIDNPRVYDSFDSHIVIKDKKINASGQNYVICIDRDGNKELEWEFYAAGVLDNGMLRENVSQVGNGKGDFELNEDFVYKEWNFGRKPAVGDTVQDQDQSAEGMAIKISEIQATPATWRLVPQETSIKNLNRGELIMTIAPEKAQDDASTLDLSTASGKIDITDRGWFLDAPKVNKDTQTVNVTDSTSLGISVNAYMAGGNVNVAGATSVVKVSYTVTPIFDIEGEKDDIQSVPSGGNNSNRYPNESVGNENETT